MKSAFSIGGVIITAPDLGLGQAATAATGAATDEWDGLTLEQAEERLIRRAMARHQGQAEAAADALGLSRSAFYRRLQKFGLTS